jgi:hypothetical protein
MTDTMTAQLVTEVSVVATGEVGKPDALLHYSD